MGIDISHDKDNNFLVITVTGELNLAILNTAAQQIVSSDQHAADISTLWDVSQVDTNNLDQGFFEELIALRKNLKGRGNAKLALVANSDLRFGLSRMYELLSGELPQSMHVFRTLDEAKEWLSTET